MSSTGICSATKRRRLARLQTRHADGSHHADHHWYGVRLDTIQSRHGNDNYQTSQRKPQDISHQVHQIYNSKRSWLCGGHHLTRQCMYGNCTQSNLFAKKKMKRPHHVNSDFLNATLTYHCGTVFITKPHSTNITMIWRSAIIVNQGLWPTVLQRSWWHIVWYGTRPCQCGRDDPWILSRTRQIQIRHHVNQDFCANFSFSWGRHGVHHGTMQRKNKTNNY